MSTKSDDLSDTLFSDAIKKELTSFSFAILDQIMVSEGAVQRNRKSSNTGSGSTTSATPQS